MIRSSKKLLPQLIENNDEKTSHDSDAGLLEKPKVAEPSFYKVILMNDDFTPMDFVIHILEKFYQKTSEDAQKVMLDVHKKGHGVAGVYSFEVAETKVFMTNNYSKQNKYPLKCNMEKD